MQHRFKLTVGLLAMCLSPAAFAQTMPSTQPSIPSYSVEPWNENYSYLKDPSARTDLFDPLKYIPIAGGGSTYLSLGGQVRERYEYFNNNNFGAGPQDGNGYYLTRVLLHGDLHIGDDFRFYTEVKSSLIDNRDGGPRASDSDEFDLQQAFADFKLPFNQGGYNLTLRAGRQDLLYGAQRLIGPLDWSNTRRTFEGVKASLKTGDNTLDLFWVRPVVVKNEGANGGDGNTSFAGLYDTLAMPAFLGADAKSKLETYALALDKTKTPAFDTAPAVAVDSDTYTLGVRLSSNPKPFDFDVEADYQCGQSGAGQINAYSIASEVGYTLVDVPLKPRAFLGFDLASGDDGGANPDKQTFNQLFPTGHLYFGYIDAIGRQNIIDLHPGVSLALLKNQPYAQDVSLRTEYHLFWRQSTDDSVYNAAGGVLRARVAGNDDRFIGSELDLLLNWQIDRHFSAYAGYSHFFPGDFINSTGANDGIDFAYVAGQFTF